MLAARFVVSTGLAWVLCVAAQAQSPATVTFRFEDQRMQPAKYTITVHEDGTGEEVLCFPV